MIKALFKFAKFPNGFTVIDTTSNSGEYRELSPFILPAPPAKNLENLWQFSKVYKSQLDKFGNPSMEWRNWHKQGYQDIQAHRYPMGKGAIPEYSFWNGKHLDYIDARKQIYAPEYAGNVVSTNAYAKLDYLYRNSGNNIILLDYDAYDHQALGMTLKDVINNPKRKMGHAFVLLMMLTGQLTECLEGV